MTLLRLRNRHVLEMLLDLATNLWLESEGDETRLEREFR